jgi:phage terminase Nu1 subunit (DNA packaging protein)
MSRQGRPEVVVPFRRPGRQEPWVSAQRVANYFGVSVRTVQRWKSQGVPCLDHGGIVRFRLSSVETWLGART